MNNYEVLIIGGDHHNTLSTIRSLGKHSIKFELLIHSQESNSKKLMVSHSKYVNNITIVGDNERSIITWLLSNKSNLKDTKVLLYPCSDLAAYTIDKNFSDLNDSYIISGFFEHPGLVVKYMDKYEQKKWAEKNNIQMAKTWEINLQDDIVLSEIDFPCILKPKVSALGAKSDIKVANNIEEFNDSLKLFLNRGYGTVLVQQFLIKKYEICAHGFLSKSGKYYGAISKKIIENPPKGGGSLAFAQLLENIEEINLKKFVEDIIEKLHLEGYSGMYDIECLICDDGIYLNEINFRQSGNNYALLDAGIDSSYYYYLDFYNEKIVEKSRITLNNFFHLDEMGIWNLYRRKYISFKELVKYIKKTKSFALYRKNDKNVFRYVFKSKILGKVLHK